MKRFRAFIKKEFHHITRDWRTLIILIGMPIIQIMLFGFAITNEINNAKIAILDHARDEHSAVLINKILSTDYFQLDGYKVGLHGLQLSLFMAYYEWVKYKKLQQLIGNKK